MTLQTEIILHARNTLLFHNNSPWQKANADDLFDVTMGSYDGVETRELIDTHILDEIKRITPKEDVGLYRDVGLAVIHKAPRKAKNVKQKLYEKFKQLGLKITDSTNMTIVDFLDVTFDLKKKHTNPYGNQVMPTFMCTPNQITHQLSPVSTCLLAFIEGLWPICFDTIMH